MDTHQAANLLGISVRRVQAMVRAGQIVAVKHGRDYWIEPEALNAVSQRIPGYPRGRPRHSSALSRLTPTAKDASRFWAKVKRGDGCWEWTGYRTPKGYGRFELQNQSFPAHRVAWLITFGSLPDAVDVMHTCDNPSCCRPDHLSLGTNDANVQDRVAKNRSSGGSLPGEHHPQAKLSWDLVRQLRALASSHVLSHSELAERFGIARQTVSDILAGRSWREDA